MVAGTDLVAAGIAKGTERWSVDIFSEVRSTVCERAWLFDGGGGMLCTVGFELILF
jgi:hypothetical protein